MRRASGTTRTTKEKERKEESTRTLGRKAKVITRTTIVVLVITFAFLPRVLVLSSFLSLTSTTTTTRGTTTMPGTTSPGEKDNGKDPAAIHGTTQAKAGTSRCSNPEN